jgi:hypothetical protein
MNEFRKLINIVEQNILPAPMEPTYRTDPKTGALVPDIDYKLNPQMRNAPTPSELPRLDAPMEPTFKRDARTGQLLKDPQGNLIPDIDYKLNPQMKPSAPPATRPNTPSQNTAPSRPSSGNQSSSKSQQATKKVNEYTLDKIAEQLIGGIVKQSQLAEDPLTAMQGTPMSPKTRGLSSVRTHSRKKSTDTNDSGPLTNTGMYVRQKADGGYEYYPPGADNIPDDATTSGSPTHGDYDNTGDPSQPKLDLIKEQGVAEGTDQGREIRSKKGTLLGTWDGRTFTMDPSLEQRWTEENGPEWIESFKNKKTQELQQQSAPSQDRIKYYANELEKYDIQSGQPRQSRKHYYDLAVQLLSDQQGVAEGGPFSYGAKKPRRGSVAANAEQKRKEQERNRQPIEPKDQMVGTARVTKGVAEGFEEPSVPGGRWTYSGHQIIANNKTPNGSFLVLKNKNDGKYEIHKQVGSRTPGGLEFVGAYTTPEETEAAFMKISGGVKIGVAEGTNVAKDMKELEAEYNAQEKNWEKIQKQYGVEYLKTTRGGLYDYKTDHLSPRDLQVVQSAYQQLKDAWVALTNARNPNPETDYGYGKGRYMGDSVERSVTGSQQINVIESLADEFAKMLQDMGRPARVAGTPEQERERTRQELERRSREAAQRQSMPLSDQERGELEQTLRELERKIDPNYQYSDDYSVWSKNHALAQQIADIKRRLGIMTESKKKTNKGSEKYERGQFFANQAHDKSIKINKSKFPQSDFKIKSLKEGFADIIVDNYKIGQTVMYRGKEYTIVSKNQAKDELTLERDGQQITVDPLKLDNKKISQESQPSGQTKKALISQIKKLDKDSSYELNYLELATVNELQEIVSKLRKAMRSKSR